MAVTRACRPHPTETPKKVGEGLAFVKLWPLDKTGARSPSLKTGFPPPTIAELASRTSERMDIEMLVGRDGMAAVTAAKAAAEAEAAATVAAAAVALEAVEVESSVAGEGVISKGGGDTVAVPPPEGSGEEVLRQRPPAPAAEAALSTEGGGAAGAGGGGGGSSSSRAALDDEEATSTAAGPATGVGAGAGAGATPLRSLALEVEVFAVGSINVLYLMTLIKACFEQVQYGVRAPRVRTHGSPPPPLERHNTADCCLALA